jgi:integrase/recombinase XerC
MVTERKGKLIVRQGKGGKYREIPLNKDARRTLQCIGYAENAGTELPIFTGQRGNLTPQGVLKIIRKYAKIADLENVSPHNLRHTFCKNLEEAGEIATLAGHESLDTTRIYTEPSFRNLEEAVERIEEES